MSGGEAGDVIVHLRAWKRAKEFDECAIIPGRRCGNGIERRHLFTKLGFLLRSQIAATNLIIVTRTTRVHQQCAFAGQCICKREMDLVWPARNWTDCAHRGVEHDDVSWRDAQCAEVGREFLSRVPV